MLLDILINAFFFFFPREQLEASLKGLNFERGSQQFIKSHVSVLAYQLGAWKALVAAENLGPQLRFSLSEQTHGLGLDLEAGEMAMCNESSERHNICIYFFVVSTLSGKVLGLSLPSVALVAEGPQLMLVT